jgi:Amt family ammonium transporter
MESNVTDMTMQLSYALDTFYFLVCGALVMWMAAGFTMLEAGLVRAKNTTVILTKNVALYAIACVAYLFCGYQIMYGGSDSSFLPGFGFLIGQDHTPAAVLAGGRDAPYYSVMADFFFQVVFVATAMSIVSGAVAERMKLWSFLLFVVVMTGFIYPVQGYWKWGGGFLDQLGFLDFAGSGVVHLTGAAAALAAVLLLGPRTGKYGNDGNGEEITPMRGANMPLATLGTLILWLGWFGFNGGSELKLSNVTEANAVAQIFVNTNMAGAGGVIAALLFSRWLLGKADLSMILNGVIAGLVAITAEPLTPSPLLAVIVGAVGGVIVVYGMLVLDKLKLDDPVGAIAAHGMAGIWGLLAVPLSNPQAAFSVQLLGTLVIFGWVFGASLAVWYILRITLGIRVSKMEELHGVDVAETGVPAYPEFVPVIPATAISQPVRV